MQERSQGFLDFLCFYPWSAEAEKEVVGIPYVSKASIVWDEWISAPEMLSGFLKGSDFLVTFLCLGPADLFRDP